MKNFYIIFFLSLLLSTILKFFNAASFHSSDIIQNLVFENNKLNYLFYHKKDKKSSSIRSKVLLIVFILTDFFSISYVKQKERISIFFALSLY